MATKTKKKEEITINKDTLKTACTELLEVMELDTPIPKTADEAALQKYFINAGGQVLKTDKFGEETTAMLEHFEKEIEQAKEEGNGEPAEAKAETKEEPPKKTAKAQGADDGAGKKRGKASERMAFLAPLIKEGKYNRKQLLEKAMKKFPEATAGAITTILSDGKNPKYNKFEKLIIQDKEGVLSFKKGK